MGRVFQTKIRQVRLTVSPFTSEQMAEVGSLMISAKSDRIRRGLNSNDAPSKPLVARYADRKIKRGRAPIRDWSWSGLMLGSLKVKVATQDRVTIGMVNATADARMTIQRRREEMLSDSPRDEVALKTAIFHVAQRKSVIRVIRSEVA